jgi:hypothetical protein
VAQPCEQGTGELSKGTKHARETWHRPGLFRRPGPSSRSNVAAQSADVQSCLAARFDSWEKLLAAPAYRAEECKDTVFAKDSATSRPEPWLAYPEPSCARRDQGAAIAYCSAAACSGEMYHSTTW